MAGLKEIVTWLDETLKTSEIPDYSGAQNGLQVENDGTVSKVGAAVDASLKTIQQAVEQDVDLLIVHHGLFWQGVEPVTRAWKAKLELLLNHNIAVYSSHLPLDIHPTYGNNAILCKKLGIRNLQPCFPWKGIQLGLVGDLDISRAELLLRLEKILGRPPFSALHGADQIERICLSTGGAGSHVTEVLHYSSNTFITGEGDHWTIPYAEDCHLNLIYGGHYLTEVFGVQSLVSGISERNQVQSCFLKSDSFL